MSAAVKPPTVISVSGVSKRFVLHKHKSIKERIVNFGRARRFREDFWALRDIDIEIEAGTTVGLVGHNGSGKSTLLKVMGGIIDPSDGRVLRKGRLAALLELGAGFHPDLTGRENVYLNAAILGLKRREIDRHFDEIVEFSGIHEFIDTQVKFYSSGMYVRLAFAVAVHVDPDVLLVDEVLAVGDEPFQKKCMDKIAEFQAEGRTIVLVSHSADQVGALCDRVIVLDQGAIIHDGDPAEGIRILRDGYERDRVAEVATSVNEEEDMVAVDLVELETSDSGFGTDLKLSIDVHVKEKVPDWGVGISIENTLGAHLYAADSFGEEIKMPTAIGRHRVEVLIPDLRLGTGKYLINLGLGSSTGVNYATRPGVSSFDTPMNQHGSGLIRANPRFEAR